VVEAVEVEVDAAAEVAVVEVEAAEEAYKNH